ncbi:hypothetical protein PR202_ga24039 [Eleusine coracana subsp. coracana]|uniref:Major facilitator superfamily (MFS) profile domain-containing protein n=1 Tax=Eleusine coracana subsp. coracana TaxID=191504 RepID=A0AAV5D7V2_ELECO|nr:hypothetical protein PR202_ga24039 [Eleusine coracana subsp. coracana]
MTADGSGGNAPLLGSRKTWHEGCPGCRQERKVQATDRIPYTAFLYIWIACLCAGMNDASLLILKIRDLKIAKQEQDIGFYAGFVGATYFLGRTISAVPWGMFADKYGRKPCIVISILSVIVFNTLFGLSTSYWMAIVTRGLLGLLCGILGPIKAYATEVCRKEHQALGISLVTSSRAIALVVGPAIGGFLAQETLHFHNDDKVEAIDELEAQVDESDSEDEHILANANMLSKFRFQIFSLWAVSSRKFRGLSLTSQDVGTVLAFSGFGVLVYQLAIYPLLAKYFGPIKPFRPAAILSIFLLATYPFMANLHGTELKILINIASLLKNMFAATITIACNILQNTAVILISPMKPMQTQEQRGVANGISVTLMSLFKAVAPAAAGILFSWAQKHISGLFLPGDQILFLMLNSVSVIGLVLTFKPFFSLSSAMRRS